MKKISKKKKLILFFGLIILISFLVIGFLVIKNEIMLNQLKKEINELNKLDVTKDRYNRPIVCKGEYSIVEKSIKEYLDNYAVLLQDTLKSYHDDRLTNILSYDNYVQDGPEFNESLNYINTNKEKYNKNIDSLLNLLEESTIKNYINKKTKDKYYRNLYNDLMFSDDLKGTFEETKKLITKSKTKMNNIYDTGIEVLTFLKNNNGNWTLADGIIKFRNQNLIDQYNSMLSNISS